MKIRVLRYFLETARLGSITRAAERLYVTQPTLSRQLKALEDELGKQLFERGSTSIRLTDEGRLLKERAEDILSMVDRTTAEFKALDDFTGGELYIGCAESQGIRY
ncbi:MAG: LysR family transcriptional regulator, partial [Oxalobacter sp.]|nr:LysR family transcriptional regulator [Oxalobacter sp.]